MLHIGGVLLKDGSVDEVFAFSQLMFTKTVVSTGDENYEFSSFEKADLNGEDVWVICDVNKIQNITDINILETKGWLKIIKNPSVQTKFPGISHVGTLAECIIRLYAYLKTLESKLDGSISKL